MHSSPLPFCFATNGVCVSATQQIPQLLSNVQTIIEFSFCNSSINYELTGYINDVNSQYTQVLMEYGANQNITNVYEYGVQRNSGTFNGKKGYYMYDGRGSVSSLSGQTGGNMVQYTYDAYGVTTTINSGNSLNNPYQYNAEYTDSSTGNQYLRARYYDPTSGRFLTKDTYLGETNDPLSLNLYTYTQNNPINCVDPSGHFLLTAIAIGAGIGALIGAGTNAYKQYKQNNNSFNNFNWGSFATDTFIGGTVGAVGGAVGGMAFAGMATTFGTAAIGGGVTLTVGQAVSISAFSSIAGGMASRYVNASLNNAFYSTNRNPVQEALNPSSMLFDGAVGAVFGRLTYTNEPIYPYGRPQQTKGQQATQRSLLERFKKFCDDHGLSKIGKQELSSQVDLPEEQLLQQADDVANAVKNGGTTEYNGIRNSAVDFQNGKGNSTLAKHVGDHASDFGYTTADEYLTGAREFMEKPINDTTRAFTSADGTYFRYDTATNEFGIINKYGGISTYFKPNDGISYWEEQVFKYAQK